MERILYAVFTYENLRQGTLKPFITLTQNSSRYRSGTLFQCLLLEHPRLLKAR